MKKKVVGRLFLFLSLFLFFAFFLPNLTPTGVSIAYANSIEKEKAPDLYVNSHTMVRGKTFTLKVKNLTDDAKVSYKSANTEIASVNEDGNEGLITAKTVGSTTITVTVKQGVTTTTLYCEITVGPPAFSVKMTRSRIILGVEKADNVSVILKPSNTAENAIFQIKDTTVASISNGGRISGNKAGATYLFALIDTRNLDGSLKFAACTVIVVNSEDVLPLETYFSEHPELNLLPESQLTSALSEFLSETSESPSINSSSTEIPKPTAKVQLTFVEELDQFLNSKFDLVALRKTMEELTSTKL